MRTILATEGKSPQRQPSSASGIERASLHDMGPRQTQMPSPLPLAVALALAIAPSLGCAPPSLPAATLPPSEATGPALLDPATQPPDADILTTIQEIYARDPHLYGQEARVSVERGVVSLDGGVTTVLARQRMVADAEQTDGVRAVVDRVTVAHSLVPDPELEQKIHTALATDPVTAPYPIAVSVKDGVVQLSGDVGSWQALRVARERATGTTGARAVEVSLSVNPSESRPDALVRAEVESRLKDDVRVDPRLVRVSVQHGRIDLSGSVRDARERAIVWDDAWVPGVRAVRGHLRMSLEPDWGFRSAAAPLEDTDIRGAVVDALTQDWRLGGVHPGVAVHDGVVELHGLVYAGSARRAAEDDARNTTGVVSVVDDLAVRAQSPTARR